jgi:uncharacterized membrane protein HdeD (DUF308 family)
MTANARIYLDETDRQRPFSPREEEQDDGVLGGAPPELVSFHQRLDDFYRKGFTGQRQPYAINGAFSILAGIISLILPVFLDSGALAYAGPILVVRGALTLALTLSSPRLGGFVIALLSSLLYILTGISLMLNIFNDPYSLILLFSAYFILTGIATILFAMFCRRRYSGHWELLVVSGVLNLDLALISLSRLPEHFIWTLVIFLGLDFITHGSALLAVAFASDDGPDRRTGAQL